MQHKYSDVIRVNELSLNVRFEDGAQWPSPAGAPAILQPIKLSLSVALDLSKPGRTDDLRHSLDYSALTSVLTDSSNNRTFASLEGLVDSVFSQAFERFSQIQDMSVKVTKLKGLLRGKGVTFKSSRSRGELDAKDSSYALEGLELPVIIGLYPAERVEKQIVRLDLTLCNPVSDNPVDYKYLAKKAYSLVDSSPHLSIEAFVSFIAQKLLLAVEGEWSCITVKAAKPNALPMADSAEVEITRTLSDYRVDEARITSRLPSLSSRIADLEPPSCDASQTPHKVAIALGSNLGDRFANIELALRLLEMPQTLLEGEGIGELAKLAVVDTSFLYETEPMYVSDQPKFINCACMVETNLSPIMLLKLVKKTEMVVGRVPSFRNGPRAVDLDILLYDNETIDTRDPSERFLSDNLEGQLVVPHPRIAEREFVLRPLNDMIPDYIVPSIHKPVKVLFDELAANTPANSSPMKKAIPFPKYPFDPDSSPSLGFAIPFPSIPPTATYWTFPLEGGHPKTRIMATLNATPDSFSDGSVHNTLPAALKYSRASVVGGADIIDVGGYSTRPHAESVSSINEIDRIIPVIAGIRQIDAEGVGGSHDAILISIDTFRPEVARAAITAGANCINDVYAFTGPDYPLTESSIKHFIEMRKTAREFAVPVILMHSRGEASANKDYTNYEYAGSTKTVVEGVRVELGEKVDAAVKGKGGIRRWLVIVDPGIGFSKTLDGNLEILRYASEVTSSTASSFLTLRSTNTLSGYPLLIGPSKKSFIREILAKPNGSYGGRATDARDRGFATAAAVACAVQQGAAVVRVHDVLEMGDVTRLANAVWA